jgi:peptidoglycan/LPS O-acetylase OafA/YrhL
MKSANSIVLPNSRLLSVDALRGIAALGVVLYHAVLQTTNAVPNNFFRWSVEGLKFLSSLGYIGVFLFFVISGFCIHLQWARNSAAGKSQSIRFLTFWKRRIRRLYPPYIIAFCLFLLMAAYSVGINVTHFFVYDVVMHLLMLHNLDPATCYSINGVFWTLAIEEQLYLAYFLLLFLRKRLGWGPTLLIAAVARLAWFGFSHGVWLYTGFGIPVPEGALSHWFTWALGAVAVEAWFGLIEIPRWCRNLTLGSAAIILASAISIYLPSIPKDTLLHDGAWLLMHPLWGFGFFVVVNRAVFWEREHNYNRQIAGLNRHLPRLVQFAASIGVFSYSLYLTHELVIMQSWRFMTSLPPILNTLLVLTPATIVFAWVFYGLFEKPFMTKVKQAAAPEPSIVESKFAPVVTVGEEV